METFVGEVQSIAFGGQGIVKSDGLVVFVPFTAPGDQVRVQIVKQKKSFAEGQMVELLKPGHERTEPRCPYFGVCGGCQFQHLKYDEQLKQKKLFVQDALQRIGKIRGAESLTIVPATHQWAYRRHIRLTLRPGAIGYEAGYVREDYSGILPITQCPIFAEPSDPIFTSLQSLLQQLTPPPNPIAHVSIIRGSEKRYVLAFQFEDISTPSHARLISDWLPSQRAQIAGAILTDRKQSQTFGDCSGEFAVDRLRIKFSPMAFVQCHPEQSLNVYHEVQRLAQQCQAQSVLDLYCGIGVTSLLLGSAGVAVTGVEGNAEAVRLAKANALDNDIGNVQFLKADVRQVLEGLLKQLNPDLVILNPPRTGLDPTARQRLLNHPVNHVIYISCMPATLARDLAALQEHGFVMKSCRAFDMFPQTTHVETVVWMERQGAR